MKRLTAWMCLALVFCLLVGCTPASNQSETQNTETTEPTVTTQAPTTQTTEPTTEGEVAETESTENSSATLDAAHPYYTVVQAAIERSQPDFRPGDGLIYDIDGNGVVELIMVYICSQKYDGNHPMVCDVYTMAGYDVIPLLEQHTIHNAPGGSTGSAGVATVDGKNYLYIANRFHDKGGVNKNFTSGTWELYSLKGAMLTPEITVEYSLVSTYENGEEKFIAEESSVKRNGETISLEEYDLWKDSLTLINADLDSNFGNATAALGLEELLEKLSATPVDLMEASPYYEVLRNRVLNNDDTDMRSAGSVLLYDIDSNGAKELILIYYQLAVNPITGEDTQHHMICEIYTTKDRKAVPLMDPYDYGNLVGGVHADAGALSIDGETYFYISLIAYDRAGEYEQRTDTWQLFTVESDTLQAAGTYECNVFYLNTENGEELNKERCSAKRNGETINIDEYLQWRDDLTILGSTYGLDMEGTHICVEDLLASLRP